LPLCASAATPTPGAVAAGTAKPMIKGTAAAKGNASRFTRTSSGRPERESGRQCHIELRITLTERERFC